MSLATNLQSFATRVATEIKAVRATLGNLTTLTTSTKTNLVSAINEVKAIADAASGGSAGATINDTTPSASTVYSSSKTEATITAAVNAVIDGAPGAIDTLNELAAALGDDPNFATTVNTALSNRVRTDTATQGLNATQQGNARTNIGAAASTHTHALTSADVTGTLPVAKGGTGATTAAAGLAALGGAASTDVGDTSANFVTTFEAGLV